MALISLVVGDFGWIMEEFAKRLAECIPESTIDNIPNPNADLIYFLPYSAWQPGYAGINIALFTHIEQIESAYHRFFKVAEQVDYCITISSRYENELRNHGISHVKTITPGVDHKIFSPKVKIGVVGRTYHTGRKGEALINAVFNEPGIDWYFTGEGWPGPAQNLSPSQMPDFYRSMDYILVPSLIEGGPMCVLESLACGREVIAPDVGFVNDYPHISYEKGDAEDLRGVLQKLVEKKKKLSESVLHRTWDAFVSEHLLIFNKFVQLDPAIKNKLPRQERHKFTTLNQKQIPLNVSNNYKIALILQDSESISKGGPSVRARRTVQAFQHLGIDAQILKSSELEKVNADITHLYNVWQPKHSLKLIQQVFTHGSPLVFSPIFLDLGELKEIVQILSPAMKYITKRNIIKAIEKITKLGKIHQKKGTPLIEWHPGYFSQVQQMIRMADAIICLSDYEKQLLVKIGCDVSKAHIVRNGIDTTKFEKPNPDLFCNHYGISDFVLCVGRIEARKNQLMLIKALIDQNIPLVFIGGVGNEDYLKLLKKISNSNVFFIDYIEPDNQLLTSAYAACRVFALPSICEGAPLAALEAGAAGAPLVLSDRSGEKEYFDKKALYCDPTNPESIKEAVLNTFETTHSYNDREVQKKFIIHNYNIERHAIELLEVYQSLQDTPKRSQRDKEYNSGMPIYIDITSLVHVKNKLTGMLRVELMITHELLLQYPDRCKLCFWNQSYKEITQEEFIVICNKLKEMRTLVETNQEHSDTDKNTLYQFIRIVLKKVLSDHAQSAAKNAWRVYKEAGRVTYRAFSYPFRFIHRKFRKNKAIPTDSISSIYQNVDEIDGVIDRVCKFKNQAALFVPGSAWISNNHYTRDLIRTIHKHDLHFSAMVFDVLPIDFPEFFPPTTVATFTFGLFNIIRHSNTLFTISKYSYERIKMLSEAKDIKLPQLSVLRLGENLNINVEGLYSTENSIIKTLNNKKFVLYVSTLNPRKNHTMMYRVWKTLFQELGKSIPLLVFAGDLGWNNENFQELLKRDIQMTDIIHITGAVSDFDIEWLYRNCLFTVYPSLAEGWGLPISESLNHGKFCICSNTTAMTEIAPELTETIDPIDVKQWYKAILRYISNNELLEKREMNIEKNHSPNKWDTCANSIYDTLNKQLSSTS